MMRWYRGMYLSDSVKGRAKKIREDMEKGVFPQKVWVVSIPIGEKDQLDIRRASSLQWHGLWNRIPMIVGLAGSQSEAFALIGRIAKDCLRARGDGFLRLYLTQESAEAQGNAGTQGNVGSQGNAGTQENHEN